MNELKYIVCAWIVLRTVDTNWAMNPSNLPLRYLPPGSLKMLHIQFGEKVSSL